MSCLRPQATLAKTIKKNSVPKIYHKKKRDGSKRKKKRKEKTTMTLASIWALGLCVTVSAVMVIEGSPFAGTGVVE
jgi:hypothetical protein